MTRLYSFICIATLFSTLSFAEIPFRVDYGGSGCPAGSASFSSDSEGQLIFELHDFFVAGNSGGFTRKNCSISVLISMPENSKVVFSEAKVLGQYDVKQISSGYINAEAFISGFTSPVSRLNLSSFSRSNFSLNVIPERKKSACGQDTILRVNSSAFLRANSNSFIDVQKIVLAKPELISCSENDFPTKGF